MVLKAKELDQDVAVLMPTLAFLRVGQPLEISFGFDNPTTRKAFSFHLLGQGRGAIEIIDFSVLSKPMTELMAVQKEEQTLTRGPGTSLGLQAHPQ